MTEELGIALPNKCPGCGDDTKIEDAHVKLMDPLTFFYQCETCDHRFDLDRMSKEEAGDRWMG